MRFVRAYWLSGVFVLLGGVLAWCLLRPPRDTPAYSEEICEDGYIVCWDEYDDLMRAGGPDMRCSTIDQDYSCGGRCADVVCEPRPTENYRMTIERCRAVCQEGSR